MPQRAARPCSKPGCSALVTDNRYCSDHADQVKVIDRWRGSAASRGYDHAWAKVRALALKRDKYLCVNCLREGRVTPARDVHHIAKIRLAPHLRLVLKNLISVCAPCHELLERTSDYPTPP